MLWSKQGEKEYTVTYLEKKLQQALDLLSGNGILYSVIIFHYRLLHPSWVSLANTTINQLHLPYADCLVVKLTLILTDWTSETWGACGATVGASRISY